MANRAVHQSEPIPGYRLIERLGVGGYGEVWKCEAPGGLIKAIKIVHGSLQSIDGGELHAQQELKALNRVKAVRHPFILSLERYDVVEGQLIIVMELADRSVWDRFKECRSQGLSGIPRPELLSYMEETAEALDLMRDQYQLQHLDVKPQNLFLVHNHIKVADFGLVKDLEGMRAHVSTGVTPVYAAPETFDGLISNCCDQYSLAIVYQELLTGQRPFIGNTVHQLLMQHLTGKPDLLPLPPGDRAAIARGLAKKPQDRYPGCTQLVEALRHGDVTETIADPSASGALLVTPTVSPPQAPPVESAPPERTHPRTAPSPGPQRARKTGVLGPQRPAPPEVTLPRVPSAPAAVPATPTPPRRAAPPEIQGAGVLRPALVIGIGHLGLGVLSQLRKALHERCGTPSALPHLRLLYIDTDPARAREALQGDPDAVLTENEIVLARLSRPVHYLKPVRGRPRVDAWLKTKMLYRIPREQDSTTGVRALGRLAFIDNFPTIATRLQSQLEACLAPSALTTACQKTHLEIQTNRPRVYVAASLAGGTGSGMFLDMAYVVREQLRQLGYPEPEVVGLLLLPAVETTPGSELAVGNAYAALTELHHFASPQTVFNGHYDDNAWPLCDPGAPFRRCVLLPLPAEKHGAGAVHEVVARAGDFLCRDLTTPLGRAADQARDAAVASGRWPVAREGGKPAAALTTAPWRMATTFGLHWISWPQHLLVQRVSRRLCQRLAQDWLSRDRPNLRQAVQTWLAEQWAQRQLSFEGLAAQLQMACAKAIGQPPEAALAAATAGLGERGFLSRPVVEPEAAQQILDQVEKFLGRPAPSSGDREATTAGSLTSATAVLIDAVDQAAQELNTAGDQHLAQITASLIDEPSFHLSGAEEAIRQIQAVIQQMLHSQQPLCQQLTAQAAEVHARIRVLFQELRCSGSSWFSRKSRVSGELADALRLYAKVRLESLVLHGVFAIYRHLLTRAAERLREIEFCRSRLTDFARTFEEPLLARARKVELGAGQYLLPGGCRTIADAATRMDTEVTDLDFLSLDRQVQQAVQGQFRSLLHVCLSKSDLFGDLETAMQQTAATFVTNRLGESDVVQVYLKQHADKDRVIGDIGGIFAEAGPELGAAGRDEAAELIFLATPQGEAAEEFRALAAEALPEVPVLPVASTDEIVVYREAPVVLEELPQLGVQARTAYDRLLAEEQFTPHSRCDVFDWLPVEER